MALYYLELKTFGRSDGSTAPGAAAYRAGERIRDERTGRTYDHSHRQDVMHKEILLPSRFADEYMDWARDRASLWNEAEAAETRKNARTAREYLVALPVELSAEGRVALVRGFSQELADRYRFAVDLAIHAPRELPGSDPRNYHAHLLATTREVSLTGLAEKTTLEWNDNKRRELFFVRERWATVTNEALRSAHVAARIDHRSLEEQGIDREPQPRLPRGALETERRGFRSVVAEAIRADYAERVRARHERASLERGPRQEAARATAVESGAPATSRDLDEIRRQAREDWLRLREKSSSAENSRGRTAPDTHQARRADRSHDDDLGR